MYVEVDLSAGPRAVLALRDVENFRDFKVVALGGDPGTPAFADAVSAIGELDDDGHAWLSTEAVSDLAGARGTEADWAASFAAMLEYAGAHGFLSEDRARVRAHCERGDGVT